MNAADQRSQIAHLLRRAGFGASEAELDAYTALGFEASVDRLLNPERVEDDLEGGIAALGLDTSKLGDLQLLWLYRMVNTHRPLAEKMTLFWHGHFATAAAKVNSPFLMWRQNELFRARGLGNFGDLTLAVSQDPAMLLWLDGNANRKASPNENYGRELLELFMLGIGNYSEADVWAAARAFTGWYFRGQRGDNNRYISAEFYFAANQHDSGPKTFLGQTGAWNGDDIIRIALGQPACARWIARKLFSYFVWDAPDDATIAPFADAFTQHHYDIRETLRAILLSPEFRSPRAFGAKIKSPAELVAGTLRTLGMTVPPRDVLNTMRRMGQELLNPPHVGGWTSGVGWINPSSLLERFNFANRIVTTRGGNGGAAFDPGQAVAGKGLGTPESLVDYFVGLLLDGQVSPEQRSALIGYLRLDDGGQPGAFTLNARTLDSKVRGLIHLTMATPAFQLN